MDKLARPIFIVAPPQSGSSYLFEALGTSPSVLRLGRRGRAVLDQSEELDPATRGHDSNRRDASDATPETAERLRHELRELLAERSSRDAASAAADRFVDATARHSLRVPFLDAIFPDAQFVYLYREPRDTLVSMLAAWQSGDYVTYGNLPDWHGPPWSMLLIPGWRELAGKPLAEIVAAQWIATARILLDDLEELPPERWCVVDYAALAADPGPELDRLCDFLGIEWDGAAELDAPNAHVTRAGRDVQERVSESLQAVLPRMTGLGERARDLLADPVSRRPTPTPDADSPLRSVYTGSVPRILTRLGASLLTTTYGTDRLVCVRQDGPRLNTHFRRLPRPTGIALGPDRLAVGTRGEVHTYRNSRAALDRLNGDRAHDACFVPRSRHFTGDVAVHDIAFADGELWLVATRFSCLATLDEEHNFVPRWRPPFVRGIVDDDRCHLTGLAVADGRPAFVTALGETDEPGGWRENKLAGGCVVEVESSSVIASGLSLPHSPRWHRDRLWVLESGEGALCTIDPTDGTKETIAQLPGFTRGLALAGGLAFVGLSRPRQGAEYGGMPLLDRFEERFCGIWIVDIERGEPRGYLRFEEELREVFDVAVLPGMSFPEIADATSETAMQAFTLP